MNKKNKIEGSHLIKITNSSQEILFSQQMVVELPCLEAEEPLAQPLQQLVQKVESLMKTFAGCANENKSCKVNRVDRKLNFQKKKEKNLFLQNLS